MRSSIAKKIWQTIHPRNFGCGLSVIPPVHSVRGREGNQMSSRWGKGYVIFSWREMCNCVFSLRENHSRNGVGIVVAFKNVYTLGTCF